MTSTDSPLNDDSPSDVPSRGPSKEKETGIHSQKSPDAVNQEERQFILLLLKRDAHTWREFVSRYDKLIISRILSTCRECGMVPASELVEDCGAEVMAALFQGNMNGLRQFQGRSKLSTWLAVITRRTTLNYLSRQRRDTDKIQPNDSQFDIATVPQKSRSDSIVIDADDSKNIQNCMNELKKSDRCVLVLYFNQNLSYAEIGQKIGISENAVGPKLHRAQKRLKKIIQSRSQQT
ncbi:sigma-70 family RNA polymerase sigma factor [uncultured Gimesia sp.]|uniref:RNA polymerase sigma factor n=1 Tax=uncultured Gimesia sp. TaxID=1678688 RepID=UPI00262E49B1|nr:sigma-70 family RNA polymerase sigma factor [uncultured Gimesia sp.]